MKERPILFSGPMVKAILDGTKTQTRRVVKECKQIAEWGYDGKGKGRVNEAYGVELEENGAHFLMAGDQGYTDCVPCPYGQPGDRLWVRETWYCDDFRVQIGPFLRPDDWGSEDQERMMYYRATDSAGNDQTYTGFSGETMNNPWRPSIFMPRWASRITLEIVSVRVELVQEISYADALSEGILRCGPNSYTDGETQWISPQRAYEALWDSVNAKRGFGWKANPWVWILEFKRIKP